MFQKLNIKWVRLWGGELAWFYVEPVAGKFDFRTADKVINGYLANHVQILGVLGYPPLWAAEPPPATGETATSPGSPAPSSAATGAPMPFVAATFLLAAPLLVRADTLLIERVRQEAGVRKPARGGPNRVR